MKIPLKELETTVKRTLAELPNEMIESVSDSDEPGVPLYRLFACANHFIERIFEYVKSEQWISSELSQAEFKVALAKVQRHIFKVYTKHVTDAENAIREKLRDMLSQ